MDLSIISLTMSIVTQKKTSLANKNKKNEGKQTKFNPTTFDFDCNESILINGRQVTGLN